MPPLQVEFLSLPHCSAACLPALSLFFFFFPLSHSPNPWSGLCVSLWFVVSMFVARCCGPFEGRLMEAPCNYSVGN